MTSLIGPNGAGKTTLFNAICGVIHADAGTITIGGRDVSGRQPHQIAALGVARSFQNARLFGDMTVAENVAIGAFAWPARRRGRRSGHARRVRRRAVARHAGA